MAAISKINSGIIYNLADRASRKTTSVIALVAAKVIAAIALFFCRGDSANDIANDFDWFLIQARANTHLNEIFGRS